MIIRKTQKLSTLEYYVTHLQIINAILPVKLTPKEIELLANFMSLNGSIAEDRFGTTGRAIVKSKMNITTAGVSNYLKSLKDKGFVKQNDILPILFPEKHNQLYQFKLVNYETE
jgi:DNA-binding MarR family transcriptional regulator